VGLRAAGLGSVKGVILGREKGVALGCDLTLSGVILYTVEDFGCLVHEIESCRAASLVPTAEQNSEHFRSDRLSR